MNDNIKVLEVRDAATCMPVMAIKLDDNFSEKEDRLIHRAGYGGYTRDYVLFIDLVNDAKCQNDAYKWGTNPRTLFHAHRYIKDHWDEIESGDVVDVQFILGETSQKKVSEVN